MSEEAVDFVSFVASGGGDSASTEASGGDAGPDLVELADKAIKEQQKPTEEPKAEEKSDDKPKEEPKVEAKTEEAKPSDRVAAFNKAREQEKARLEEKKAQTELRKAQEELQRYRALEEKLKTNTLAALEDDFKVPYSKITDQHIERLEKDPTDPKLKALEQRLADAEKALRDSQTEKQQAAAQATIQKLDSTIREQVSKSQDLTYLPEYGDEGVELVRETIAAHFMATSVKDAHGNVVEPGEVMSESDAIKLVEEHYTKIATKLEAAKAKKSPKTEPAKPQPEAKPKPTTLSADLQRSAQQQPLTAQDELAEQLEWLKQQGAAVA